MSVLALVMDYAPDIVIIMKRKATLVLVFVQESVMDIVKEDVLIAHLYALQLNIVL